MEGKLELVDIEADRLRLEGFSSSRSIDRSKRLISSHQCGGGRNLVKGVTFGGCGRWAWSRISQIPKWNEAALRTWRERAKQCGARQRWDAAYLSVHCHVLYVCPRQCPSFFAAQCLRFSFLPSFAHFHFYTFWYIVLCEYFINLYIRGLKLQVIK